jgi:hypothetical protein
MQFEPVKPPGRAFPPSRTGFEHFVAIDTPVMAYFKGSGVNKTDPGGLPPPEKLGIDEQGDEGAAGQFHEPVITNRSRKIVEQMETNVTLVIPVETAVAAEVEQQDDSHHLTQGQAACRKPGFFSFPWQTMGLTIGFKRLTKVIDIAIDSGYTSFVHKKPLPFPVY